MKTFVQSILSIVFFHSFCRLLYFLLCYWSLNSSPNKQFCRKSRKEKKLLFAWIFYQVSLCIRKTSWMHDWSRRLLNVDISKLFDLFLSFAFLIGHFSSSIFKISLPKISNILLLKLHLRIGSKILYSSTKPISEIVWI